MKLILTSAAALMLSAASALAVTVSFDFTNGSTSVASGSFSYDDSLDGTIIDFGDLDTFNFTIQNDYDLSYIAGTTFSPWLHMAFDSSLDVFQAVSISGYPTILAAIADDFGSGFFVRPADNVPLVRDYGRGSAGEMAYDTLTISVNRTPTPAPVPLPAGVVLLASGLGAAGLLRRRKAA